ncbi:regulatory LuxR family protein [Saccharopolyspora erythraea NRRL 2338]|uniref:LuxR-family transcriptional regulator n=2 Tax=Saccharopolyspora erythraea TaxID=1836 RepID=A4FDQ2_SACEN|nr:LuxR family transcriptional regulator [Saccharopolyspora erythraea]PFG95912.1 regulatory LuxR family protein [Saccharopolyspora erythraea NRRL 2338]QRK92482.1 LuxR family transcriptional regulator [Saccharopolyspora erythraea]CAM02177.1 LuxR-family transcriptional regulator [Saccharopolyspora erythraea NRRL 2338]
MFFPGAEPSAAVSAVLDEVRRGGRASLLLEGVRGAGKTTLLEAAAERARGLGLDVVRLPVPTEERDAGRRGRRGTDVEAFDPPAGKPLRDGRLVVLADDLHRMDTAALHCLSHLLTRHDHGSVAVVATAAHGDYGRDPSAFNDAVARFRRRAELRPLTRAAVAETATRVLGQRCRRGFAEECLRHTGGNPLYLRLLLEELRIRGVAPVDGSVGDLTSAAVPAIADVLPVRGPGFEPEAVAVVNAVALLQPNAAVDLVAQLVRLDDLWVADTLDRLLRQRFLTRRGAGYELDPPVVRAAVLARMSADARDEGHTRAAELLYAQGADAEVVAAHLLRIQRRGMACWACRVLRECAVNAIARGDGEEADRYLQHALEQCTGQCRADILRELGKLALGARPDAAPGYLSEALWHCASPRERAEIRGALANSLYLSGDVGAATRVLQDGVAEAEPSDVHGAAALREELRLFTTLAGRAESVAPASGDNSAVAGEPGPGGSSAGRGALVNAALHRYWRGHDRGESARLAERAIEHGPQDHVATLAVPLLLLARAGENDAALRACRRTVDEARARGAVLVEASALAVRAEIAYRAGELDECRQDAVAALTTLLARHPAGHPPELGVALDALTGALLEAGEGAEAQRWLDRAGMNGRIPDRMAFHGLLAQRGRLRIELGDREAGMADLRECGRRMRSGPHNPTAARWRSELALAVARAGGHAEAVELAETELEQARKWGAPEEIGRALRASAAVVSGAEREARLAEAVEVLAASSARVAWAHALCDLGVVLRELGRWKESRSRLRAALALAERCGAAVLAGRATRELVTSGARLRRVTEIGVEALTAAEIRVAVMAAEGRSNRQIAEELYVSRRTVETHLSRVYQKLDIPGRFALDSAVLAGLVQEDAAEGPAALGTG